MINRKELLMGLLLLLNVSTSLLPISSGDELKRLTTEKLAEKIKLADQAENNYNKSQEKLAQIVDLSTRFETLDKQLQDCRLHGCDCNQLEQELGQIDHQIEQELEQTIHQALLFVEFETLKIKEEFGIRGNKLLNESPSDVKLKEAE